MKLELLAQSATFFVLGALLMLLLGVGVHFGLARLVLSILVASVCVVAELYVIYKVLHRLWKWSGMLTGVLFKNTLGDRVDEQVIKAR
jgi:hypothetical protein